MAKQRYIIRYNAKLGDTWQNNIETCIVVNTMHEKDLQQNISAAKKIFKSSMGNIQYQITDVTHDKNYESTSN